MLIKFRIPVAAILISLFNFQNLVLAQDEAAKSEDKELSAFAGLLIGANYPTYPGLNRTTVSMGIQGGISVFSPAIHLGLNFTVYQKTGPVVGTIYGVDMRDSDTLLPVLVQLTWEPIPDHVPIFNGLWIGAQVGPLFEVRKRVIGNTSNTETDFAFGPKLGWDIKFASRFALGWEFNYILAQGSSAGAFAMTQAYVSGKVLF